MPKYKFVVDTPIEEVFAAWRASNICAEGVEQAIDFYAKRGDKTALDMAQNPMDIPTLCWDIVHFGADTDPKLREVMFSHITDDMTLFSLYVSLPFLTQNEDKNLEDRFRGKLPTAEKELADGIVTRAKWL